MLTSLSRKFSKHSDECSCHSDDTSVTTFEKTVTFCESVIVRRTMPLSEYTPEEIEATWYSDEEYDQISRQCQKQIRKLNEGKTLRDKKYCSRGLEGATDAGQCTKDENRYLAYQAVLQVQGSQREQGVYDELAIAESYRQVSSDCQLKACVVGIRDQRAAGIGC